MTRIPTYKRKVNQVENGQYNSSCTIQCRQAWYYIGYPEWFLTSRFVELLEHLFFGWDRFDCKNDPIFQIPCLPLWLTTKNHFVYKSYHRFDKLYSMKVVSLHSTTFMLKINLQHCYFNHHVCLSCVKHGLFVTL